MKFKSEEAFVYGETQLIYFSDIREHMKTGQEIELVLMNVDSSSTDGPLYNTVNKAMAYNPKKILKSNQDFNTNATNNVNMYGAALNQF